MKTVELDYLPTRNGGEDQLHNHATFNPSADTRESCGGCAQLANDFAWLRFYDSIHGREHEFRTVEDAKKYALENIENKTDPRAEKIIRARKLVA